MSIKVRPLVSERVIKKLGLEPGGELHDFGMDQAQIFMEPHLPYRDYGHVVNAMQQGKDYKGSRWVLVGPDQKYLYWGHPMAGNPRKPITDRMLNYTKNPHPMAGARYDVEMMRLKGKALVRAIMRKKRGMNQGG